jgi:hypothetical protein
MPVGVRALHANQRRGARYSRHDRRIWRTIEPDALSLARPQVVETG